MTKGGTVSNDSDIGRSSECQQIAHSGPTYREAKDPNSTCLFSPFIEHRAPTIPAILSKVQEEKSN